MKLAASSVHGDFSKTALEIEQFVKSQKKVAFDYLSYPEQLKEIEKRKAQEIKDRKRKRAANKARAKRAYNSSASFVPWDDDLTSPHAINGLLDDDDDCFIDTTIDDNDSFEMPMINVSTGLPLLSNGCGGVAGFDVGCHFYGEIPAFDDSINDSFSTFIDDSFSSFDSSSSFDDSSSDLNSCGMDEW